MAQIGSTPVFTTTEAVRAAVGVDAHDLPDQMILDAELNVELGLDLSMWLPNWKVKLDPQDPVSDLQQQVKDALKSYCKWWGALEFCRKILAHTQLYSDGKAQMRRFQNFDWEQVIGLAASKVSQYKALVASLDPEAVLEGTDGYSLISGGIPVYDPVTGEGARS